MPVFDLEINGLESVLSKIDGIESRANDLTPLATTIGLVAQADVDERFNTAPGVRVTGQVYGGVTWDALSDAYLAANPRREGGQQLRDSGELLNSFTIGNPRNILRAERDAISFGSALPKAEFLNRRRRLLFVHDELVQAIANVMEIYVIEGIT